jgi:hypothetical protein
MQLFLNANSDFRLNQFDYASFYALHSSEKIITE